MPDPISHADMVAAVKPDDVAALRSHLEWLDGETKNGVDWSDVSEPMRRCLAHLERTQQPERLWLWRNGDHYWAFRHLYPCHDNGDPQVLGEPMGWAILKPSKPSPREPKLPPLPPSPERSR